MDNTLAYIDQASFLNFRALGHGQLILFTWIYEQPINQSALQQFHRNLGRGLLGRLVERSPLPFGRHRWVSSSSPAAIDRYTLPVAEAQLHQWLDSLANLVIDPESGPGWRLATTPLIEGGSAICLLVSHSIADAVGAAQAISNAIDNRECDLGYPIANSRSLSKALRQDMRSTLRSLPELVHAFRSAASLLLRTRHESSVSRKDHHPTTKQQATNGVSVPCLSIQLNELEWDQCASRLGGTRNSLHAGLAALLGSRLGRIDRNGRVRLNVPVSLRQKNDSRANALSMITVSVDPSSATRDLTPFNIALKKELRKLKNEGDSLHELLTFIPFVPPWAVGLVEGMILESGMPVACSMTGRLDTPISRLCGTNAKLLDIRGAERFSSEKLNRSGGKLMLCSNHINGHVSISIASWQPGTANSREALKRAAEQALNDFGLSAVVT